MREETKRIAKCKQCGKGFVVSASQRKFCSKTCRDRWWSLDECRKKTEKIRATLGTRICKYCGKNFVPKHMHHLYCSRACSDLGRYAEVRMKIGETRKDGKTFRMQFDSQADMDKYLVTERICPNCGKSFIPKQTRQYCCCERCGIHYRARKQSEEEREKQSELKCKHCGKIFTPIRASQIYCSTKCANRAHLEKSRNMKEKKANKNRECVVCGKMFSAENHFQKCCSESCMVENEVKRKWRPIKTGNIVVNCVVCYKQFSAYSSLYRFCSKDCLREYITQKFIDKEGRYRKDIICPVCGKKFTPRNKSHLFCSVPCRMKHMQTSDYRLGKIASEVIENTSILNDFQRLKTMPANERMRVLQSWDKDKQKAYWAYDKNGNPTRNGSTLFNQFMMKKKSKETEIEEDGNGLDGIDVAKIGNKGFSWDGDGD